jgi:hypothetical protein
MELTDDHYAITELIRRHLAAAETVGFVGGRIDLAMGWGSRAPGEAVSLEALIERSDRATQRAGRRDCGQDQVPADGAVATVLAEPGSPLLSGESPDSSLQNR